MPNSYLDQNILAIADGYERTFQIDATNFLGFFPETFNTRLLVPKVESQNSNLEVLAAMGSGNLLTAYFGHGSVSMWGKGRLFSNEDIMNLSYQEFSPIMLQFTCLTGLFMHPSQVSITESLLWQPESGSVGILAPTSLTISYDQGYLADGFVQALLRSENSRLGDVILEAWHQIPVDKDNTRDVMKTFLLFGDPALPLPTYSP
jgi:hypothetical protein